MTKERHTRVYTVVFFVAAALGVGFVCFKVLRPFLAAIAWAVVLAVAFQQPWAWLERRMPKRRSLAAALLTVALALLVLVPVTLLVAVLASQAVNAANLLTERLAGLHVTSFSDVVALPTVAEALDTLRSKIGFTTEDMQRYAASAVSQASKLVGTLSGRLLLGAVDMAFTFVMAVFLLFFMLRDGKAMAAAALGLLPTDAAGRSEIGRLLGSMLRTIFRGSLLCALAQGVAGGVGWWIAGLPSPALAGAVMGVFSLLPVGGTALLWGPGAIWLWLAGRPGAAVFLLLWGVVVASFLADNVLRPFLIRGSEELSTLVVFLGVFGGLAAFGLLGLFIGPIALVLGIALLEVMSRQADRDDEVPGEPA